MKRTLLFIFAIAFAISSFSQTSIPAGNVSGTWTKANSPYQVNGNIIIPADSILKIEPGVKVEFPGYYKINVLGKILANGAINDTILFTIPDTTGFHNFAQLDGKPGWKGFEVTSSDTSVFKYCRFEYATMNTSSGSWTDDYQGAFNIGFSNIIIEHSLFFDNYAFIGAAVSASKSSVQLRHTSFISNTAKYGGGGAYISESSGDISSCIFRKNKSFQSQSLAGALYLSNSEILINGNLFLQNYSQQGGAIAVAGFLKTATLCNNIMVNNTAEYYGGALRFDNANTILYHNTISKNLSKTSGGAIDIYRASSPVFNSNIIYDNKAVTSGQEFFIQDNLCKPEIRYCDIKGGLSAFAYFSGASFIGIYQNNADIAPLFINASPDYGDGFGGPAQNWNLSNTSPSINAGDPEIIPSTPFDYNNKPRIHYGRIDFGACEFSQNAINAGTNITSNTVWMADTVKLTNNISVSNNIKLTIYPGVLVQSQADYLITVNGSINAIGTQADSIRFTAKDSVWKGLYIYSGNSNDSTVFCYTKFEKCRKTGGNWGGAMQLSSSTKLRFNHCTFENNFSDLGGAIYGTLFSAEFNDCDFKNNLAIGGGGAILIDRSDVAFSHCLFYNNKATSNSSGGGMAVGTSTVRINNSAFLNNYSASVGGGFSANSCNVTICNSVFANNECVVYYGGGLYIDNSNLDLVNSTICNNKAKQGGGIISYGSKLNALNNIIYGNLATQQGNQLYIIETSTANIKYCNLSQKSNDVYSDKSTLSTMNLVDTNSLFITPSAGAGNAFDGLSADWMISDFSPCINIGSNDAYTYLSSNEDILRFVRNIDGIIDLGAYENQGKIPAIVKQPLNLYKCQDDTIALSVQVSGNAHYQWQKDGMNVANENDSALIIEKIQPADQANYNCVVSNSHGTVNSNNVSLSVNTTPSVLSQSPDMWGTENTDLKLDIQFSGDNPSIAWFKNGDSISGANKPVFSINNFSASDEGVYQCNISNSCGTDSTSPINVYLAPQICMVTVDSLTGKNIISWEKISKAPVKYYIVYRESIAKGIYDSIGTVAGSEFGIFRDTIANSRVQAYWYKITSVDSSGMESDIDLCYPHKTIHLLVTKGYMGGIQLDWDGYFGFPFNTYLIYRKDPDTTSFKKVYEISSSNLTWTDISVSGDGYMYFVAVKKDVPCDPAGLLKADVGPYTQSLSNIVEFKATEHSETNAMNAAGYPNPFNENLTLEFSLEQNSDVLIEVINATGQKTAEFSYKDFAAGTQQIQLSAAAMNITEGMCYIKLVANEKTSVIKCNLVK